jgi:hypothetical protein
VDPVPPVSCARTAAVIHRIRGTWLYNAV